MYEYCNSYKSQNWKRKREEKSKYQSTSDSKDSEWFSLSANRAFNS